MAKAPSIQAAAAQETSATSRHFDWAAFEKAYSAYLSQAQLVGELDQELFKKLVEADPSIVTSVRVSRDGRLEAIADDFTRKNSRAYEALGKAREQLTRLLAKPGLEKAIVGSGADQKRRAQVVLAAHQTLAGSEASGVALSWAGELLASKDSKDPRLYKLFESVDPKIEETIETKILQPSLPVVAIALYQDSGGDLNVATKRMEMATNGGLGVLKALSLVLDKANIAKAAVDLSDPVTRVANYYGRAHWLLKGTWGVGSVFGLAGGLNELSEGRGFNGARYAITNASNLATFTSSWAQNVLHNPAVAEGMKKSLATFLTTGKTGWGLKAAVYLDPGIQATSAYASYQEHGHREASVGNTVAGAGDVSVVAAGLATLFANFTHELSWKQTARWIAGKAWYGNGVVVAGELSELLFKQLGVMSRQIDPVRPSHGLQILLGLKKSSVVLDE